MSHESIASEYKKLLKERNQQVAQELSEGTRQVPFPFQREPKKVDEASLRQGSRRQPYGNAGWNRKAVDYDAIFAAIDRGFDQGHPEHRVRRDVSDQFNISPADVTKLLGMTDHGDYDERMATGKLRGDHEYDDDEWDDD